MSAPGGESPQEHAYNWGWSDAANGKPNVSETAAVPENVKEAYRRGYEDFLKQGLKV